MALSTPAFMRGLQPIHRARASLSIAKLPSSSISLLVRSSARRCLTMAALRLAPPRLIGPPEIYQNSATAEAITTFSPEINQETAAGKPDPFMDQMVANFNTTATFMGYTENRSPTYLSSGNPCLDFFFHVVPDTPPESVVSRLQLAWDQDPLKALKLICNLRGVRGTGKSDREGFYYAASWLHEHHPQTLAGNLASIAEFGYFKDLLEILYRILEGADARKLAREMRGRKMNPDENRSRAEKKIEMAKRVVERYNTDPVFRFLHDRVSDVFAHCLRSDMEMLKSEKLNKISLAAKWCPSLDLSYDRVTLLCEAIARKVFPREEYPEYEGVEDAHYAYRVRDRLRKEVLVPLRKVLELPEVYMGANDWGNLPYNRVASVAMKIYKERFLKHDGERFLEFLGKVKSGEAKIAAGALLPHQIIASLHDKEDGGEVAELQWKRMVEDLAEVGRLRNCLAICDVSGSMYGTPLDVSVALGLLVSELSEEPWKGKLITFSENPQLHIVQGETLKAKTDFVERMEWMMNTDFQKVFDVILQVAESEKLKKEEMIKRLFVFSDMEFDEASLNPWETDYKVIVRKYTEKGYGDCVPEIVFWNLRDSRAMPVPSHQPGVALVSGFSKNLMKIFLKEGEIKDPVETMEEAISGKEYEELIVID